MIATGIVVLVVGVAISVLSLLICIGKTNLIHSYHRENVKEEDKKKYAISLGLSLLIGGIGLITYGILVIIFKDTINQAIYLTVMLGSIFISIILALILNKKYNGKIMG